MEALRQEVLPSIAAWGAPHAAAGVTGRKNAVHGEAERRFAWASVTKTAVAVAVLVAVEEGIVDLDEQAGPPGATLRHLLAHASGLPFDEGPPIAAPGRRRIYSNQGFEVAAALVAERAGIPFAAYFDAVWAGTAIRLEGSPAAGATGSLRDLLGLAAELLAPARIAPETLAEAVSVQFPGLDGVLPGFGRQAPNDWGLGFELRDGKQPHWTGSLCSPATFGQFGRRGTFLWVDPEAQLALGCLTDR